MMDRFSFYVIQTLFVSIALMITSFLAIFVYVKLLFYPPYSSNHTFKLFVLNGVTELLSCYAFLIVDQLTFFLFMFDFYQSLKENNLYNLFVAIESFVTGVSLHSEYFIAMNRLKVLYPDTNYRGAINSKSVFYFSLLSMILLPTLRIINIFCFAPSVLIETNMKGYGDIMVPTIVSESEVLTITCTIQTAVVSFCTLLVNSTIAFYLIRKRELVERSASRRNQAEQGLMMTSVVSYVFTISNQINEWLASYLSFNYSKLTKFIFLGIATVAPFWYDQKYMITKLRDSASAKQTSKKLQVSSVFYNNNSAFIVHLSFQETSQYNSQ